ncbi:hypothetical protein B6E66_14210 [Streptomyces maremycinicus]|nr:hypothetical protein B6E66_14210 [Streptomyces sp. B9173]
MLMPLPATLCRLVKDYEALAADRSAAAAATSRARLRDLAYTLCVSTGTREVRDALRVARTYLDSVAARPATAGPVPGPPAAVPASARLPGCAPQDTPGGRRPVVAAADTATHTTVPALQHPPQQAMAGH